LTKTAVVHYGTVRFLPGHKLIVRARFETNSKLLLKFNIRSGFWIVIISQFTIKFSWKIVVNNIKRIF